MANDLVTVWGGVPRIGRAPANNEILIGNGSGFTLQTVSITLDNILGNTQGSVAYRSSTQWTGLIPGTANNVLQTNGASSNPSWVTPETVVNNALGGSNGSLAYKSSGDWGALSIGPGNTIIASTGSDPAWTTLSNLFDSYFTSSRQAIISRLSGGWGSVTSTTTPYLLLTNNTGNATSDLAWTSITNAIANGTPGSTFVGDILYFTSTSLAKLNIGASGTILSSTGTAPSWSTISSIFDNAIGASQGSIVYRGASQWVALSPGSANNVLQTNGSSNNPSWVTPETVVNNSLGGSDGALAYKSAGDWGALSIGSANFILASSGSAPAWTSVTLAIAGGTPGSTFIGDMLYFTSTSLSKLNIGASGTILSSTGTAPSWASLSSILDSSIGSTTGGLLYRSSTGWTNTVGYKNKSADQLINSDTVYASDTDLQFSAAAGSVYSFWGTIFYFFQLGGYDFAVDAPSGSSFIVETMYSASVGVASTPDTSCASNTGTPSASVQSVFFRGFLYTSSTAGTFSIRSKLNNSGSVAYSRAGSFIQYAKA